MISRRSALVLPFAALAGSQAQAANDYPRQPTRFIVGFPPGGGADLVSRALTPQLAIDLGQPFVVENRPGAEGRIGAELVAHAKPDGYTILITTEGAMVITPHLAVKSNYKPLVDYAPVSLLTRTQTMLVATPSLKLRTLEDVLRLARDKPGQLNYGSSGIGGPNHLAAEVLKQKTGIDIVHVPFKGSGEAIPAVMSGQVQLMFGYVPSLSALVRSGALIGIAVGGAERAKALPDIPTIAESGVPGYRMDSWVAAMAPAGTPPEVVSTLQQALAKALKTEQVQNTLLTQGFEPAGSTPEEMKALLVAEDAKYAALLKTLDLK